MAKKLIVLDPGHGGQDSGAVGNGLLEKDITLMVGRKVAQRLGAYNVTVKMTRDDDTYLSLNARSNYANNLEADYFLSIHVNAGGGTGFESFIYSSTSNTASISVRSALHKNIIKFMKNYGIVDRGEKKANFAVLRETNMPACLIENLFIDTAKDAAFLKDDGFISGLCDAITAGLVQGLNLTAPTTTDPAQGEIKKLMDAGLIANDHAAASPVTWGEFATVMNRLLNLINKSLAYYYKFAY